MNDNMLTDFYHLNCFDTATLEIVRNGGELHYGWAIGPSGRSSHVWVVRDGKIIDLFNWKDHEDLGIYTMPDNKYINKLISYIKQERIKWPTQKIIKESYIRIKFK